MRRMRRVPATAMLLVLVLSVLAPACVAGWNGSCEDVPQISTRVRCARVLLKAERGATTALSGRESRVASHGNAVMNRVQADEQCGDELNVPTERCGLRSFVQLQFARLQAAQISIPLLPAAKVHVPSRVMIAVSSVGPPETDRGPPHV